MKVAYREEPAVTDFAAAAARAFAPSGPKSGDRGTKKTPDYQRGEPEKALAAAEVRVEGTYTHPAEYHNPMEMHATVAAWDGPKLTLYDKTQWVDNVQEQVALAFGMRKEDVRVLSPFVGGAFGSALRVWPHVLLAALAAKHVGDARSPLHGAAAGAVGVADGRFFLKGEPARGETYADILKRHRREAVEATHEAKPGEEKKKFSTHAFGAHFVEVRVDPDLATRPR